MEKVISIFNWCVANYEIVVVALVAILGGYVAIMKLIPGEQGETFVEKVVAFLSKFKKPEVK